MAGQVDLSLALNLESLVQINGQFISEVTRDLDNPREAKFHYSIPRIRNCLLYTSDAADE